MAQFTLQWNNTALQSNPNVIGQRVSYRRKSLGGPFITTGFTPNNDLLVTAATALSPVLLDNVIYEFIVQTLCTVNGPTLNSNGVVEAIQFSCITPVITKTHSSVKIQMPLTGTDITKVKVTLKRTSDDTIVFGPSYLTQGSNEAIATGLLPSTSYYWEVELYAILGEVEVVSSDEVYLDDICGGYTVVTNAAPTCTELTNVSALATS